MNIPSFNDFAVTESLRGLKFNVANSSDDNGTEGLRAKLTKEQAAEMVKTFGLGFWSGDSKHIRNDDIDFKAYSADPDGPVVFGYDGALFVHCDGKGGYSCEISALGGRYPSLKRLESLIGSPLPKTKYDTPWSSADRAKDMERIGKYRTVRESASPKVTYRIVLETRKSLGNMDRSMKVDQAGLTKAKVLALFNKHNRSPWYVRGGVTVETSDGRRFTIDNRDWEGGSRFQGIGEDDRFKAAFETIVEVPVAG